MKLEGTDQVLDALSTLQSDELDKLITSSIRKALNDKVVKPLRTAIPYSARDKKAVKTMKDREFKKNSIFGGVSTDAYWLRFIDKGTKERTTKSGANRGQITGNHKISNFIKNQSSAIPEYFNNDFGPEIEKMMSRKLKRLRK